MPDQDVTTAASASIANAGGATLVASTSTQLVAANENRDQITVSATTADVWLGYGTAATVNAGIHLVAGGVPYTETGWKGSIFAISTGAAVVSYMETSYSNVTVETEDVGYTPSGPSDGHPSTDVPEYLAFGE